MDISDIQNMINKSSESPGLALEDRDMLNSMLRQGLDMEDSPLPLGSAAGAVGAAIE